MSSCLILREDIEALAKAMGLDTEALKERLIAYEMNPMLGHRAVDWASPTGDP